MPIEANCATHMGRAKRPISESTDKDGLAKGEDAAFDIEALMQKNKINAVSIKAGVTSNVMQKEYRQSQAKLC
tara:strand:- start:261 stop:479 length:219 start_codon:yes stop_codon:yes gene_type:complete